MVDKPPNQTKPNQTKRNPFALVCSIRLYDLCFTFYLHMINTCYSIAYYRF